MNELTVTPATAAPKPVSVSKLLLTLSFGTLHIADGIVTAVFIKKHGLEMEANPLMQSIIADYGFGGMFMFKFITLALWICVAQRVHWGIHVALNVFLAVVVYMGITVARG